MTNTSGTSPPLLARDETLRSIDDVVERAREGFSGVLVLRGEPGVGKTALLERTMSIFAGLMQVAMLAGVEAEVEMPYAALQRLLIPFTAGILQLPAAQRRALDAALGNSADQRPADRFLVGLATLGVLSDRARSRPLLLVIDDAQWLDIESLQVVAMVGRRLNAHGVALIVAVRDPDPCLWVLEGLSTVSVKGLPSTDALRLLEHVVGSSLDPAVSARLVAETAGNPLALIELARDMSPAQLAGRAAIVDRIPLSRRVQASYLRQVRRFPEEVQRLLLVAAAEGCGDTTLVMAAAERLGLNFDVDPAALDDLLVLRPQVRFRHPLVRAAVYEAAPSSERRRVHAALADVLDPERERDRWIWHRAAAAAEPDEGVAADLTLSAEAARARGGAGAATDLFARSAELSPDEAHQTHRWLAAAEAALTVGKPQLADRYLGNARRNASTAETGARALRLEGLTQVQFHRPKEAYRTLLEASALLADIDDEQSRDTLLEALETYLVARLIGAPDVGSLAPLAGAAAGGSDERLRARDVLLDGFASRFASGHADAAPLLRDGLAQLRREEMSADEVVRCSLLGFFAALEVWDDVALDEWAQRVIRVTRDAGALHALRVGMLTNASVRVLLGRLVEAEAQHAEHAALATVVGNHDNYPFHEVEVLAWRGDAAATVECANNLVAGHEANPESGSLLYVALNARAVLSLGEGRYDEALMALRQIFEDDPPRYGCLLLPDMVESGIRGGDRSFALTALERLEARASAAATPWAFGVLARSRALLADDSSAERFYVEAIEHLDATRMVPDRARANLLYGEWLRRRKRRTEARDQLRTAQRLFETMGAWSFAERARLELAATGERARKRSVEFANDVTPQELHIARLAAGHVTNREIATQLFISASTVEYHLHNLYRKLQISSRRELGGALSNVDRESALR